MYFSTFKIRKWGRYRPTGGCGERALECALSSGAQSDGIRRTGVRVVSSYRSELSQEKVKKQVKGKER